MPPLKISKTENFKFRFSICTLVTKPAEYTGMVESFVKAGFTEMDCQYLYADNSDGNEFEAFGSINRFLRESQGEFVIICHQDVLITIDDRRQLEDQITLVSSLDPDWAVLGNAGVNNMYNISMVITHYDKQSHRSGLLPSKVQSLDENFLLIKASANLAVAGDLEGFHLYGTDICLIAECLGYSAFAIDFHIVHNGRGIMDKSFYNLSEKLSLKYSSFFRSRYIRSTMTSFYVTSNQLMSLLMNIRIVKGLARQYYKLRFKYTGKI
ncbi:MAG: hypothetical protein ACO1NS_00380 [Daejeonella sp.]|uniref:hypothetical protein n=1 Tax=Daejeonella sp. JGW-45 TaxID=3034148 RepID=UPI0023EB85CC|nr:hypothetical protein [Daejeonella sp. JGW-45]